MTYTELPRTLGALRETANSLTEVSPDRTLKEELRSNLMSKLERGETLFPGVMGYEDTVVPQVVNAVLIAAQLSFCWVCEDKRRRGWHAC